MSKDPAVCSVTKTFFALFSPVLLKNREVSRTMASSRLFVLSFDQLKETDPISAFLKVAPAFITAVVPPTMRRRKCQAERTHATEKEYNQKAYRPLCCRK